MTNKVWYWVLGLGLLLVPIASAQTKFALVGVYQGENVFIQNPLYESERFCIEQITVNGQVTWQNPQQSAIEIKLDDIAMFSPVRIVIAHIPSCQPLYLNSHALKSGSNFKFTKLYSLQDTICFETQGEEPQAKYALERLIGQDWEHLVELESKQSRFSKYCVVPEYYQGPNKMRVCYRSSTRTVCSSSVEIWYKNPPITFTPEVVVDRMTLSEETDFEILDTQGHIVLQGHAQVLRLRLLPSGEYYIVLGGEEYSFFKK